MPDFINIELVGEQKLIADLRAAVARLQKPRELLADIGTLMEQNVNRRFDNKRDPSGKPWAPLAASTLESYRSKYKGRIPGSLLERSRQMRQSLASNIGDDYVEIGFSRLTKDGNWSVAQLHEFGTRRMPRRGLLTADPEAGELGEGDRQDILDLVAEYLDGVFD